MKILFYDRDEERKAIFSFIKENGDCAKVILISGSSGKGKSELTKHITSQMGYDCDIRVSIPYTANSSIENGYFLMKLAAGFDRLSTEQPITSFANWIDFENQKNEKGKLIPVVGRVIENILNPKSSLPKYFNDVHNTLNTKEEMIGELSFDYLSKYFRYCKYILSSDAKIVITIENYQLIDVQSYEYIHLLFKHSSDNKIFFLECTTDKSSEILKYKEGISNYTSNLKSIQISVLPINYQYDILSEYTGHDKKSLEITITSDNDNLNGNLRNLISLGDLIVQGNEYINKNATETLLLNLDRDTLSILLLISMFKNNITEHRFESIIFSFNKIYRFMSTIEDIKAVIIQHNLASFKDNISITHDYIKEILYKNKKINVVRRFIVNFLIDYFKKNIDEKNYEIYSFNESFEYLIFLCSTFDEKQLINYIDLLHKLATNQIRTKTALYAFRLIDDYIKKNNKNSELINKKMIEVYYNNGLFNEAWEKINNIKTFSFDIILFKGAILNRLGKEDEAILIFNDIKEDNVNSDQLSKIFLLKSITYASLNDYTNSKYYNEKLIDMNKNNDYTGYALRNSEIYLPLKESIVRCEQSTKIFNERKNQLALIHSLVTLSTLYTMTGNLSLGEKFLQEVKSNNIISTLEQHILINNYNCIQIYKKNYENLDDYFEEALITAVTTYDKIVILNNLLVSQIYNKKKKNLIEITIKNLLLHIKNNHDNYLNRDIYYNLYIYYRDNNETIYKFYLEKAKKSVRGDTWDQLLWDYRFFKIDFKNEELMFLKNQEYILEFINYWHFPLFFD